MRYCGKIVVATSLLLSMGACARHTWAPGPSAQITDFDQQKARCSLFARKGQAGFVVGGDPAYVAGAAAGHAIGTAINTQQDFNDCMLASGWKTVDER